MANLPNSKTRKNLHLRASKAKGGRPTRAETLRRRALACGVDPDWINPLRILAGLAIDETAPASARVAACRVLVAHSAGLLPLPPPVPAEDNEVVKEDALTRRALELMAGCRGLQ